MNCIDYVDADRPNSTCIVLKICPLGAGGRRSQKVACTHVENKGEERMRSRGGVCMYMYMLEDVDVF